MGSYSEQEWQAIKEKAIISYDDAVAIYGYQVQHFIEANKNGLVIYYYDGKMVDRPLEEFAKDCMEEEANYIIEHIEKDRGNITDDVMLDLIGAIARRKVSPVSCFLEICSFSQKQLTAIMDIVINGEMKKSKKGNKRQNERRGITDKVTKEYLHGRIVDNDKLPSKSQTKKDVNQLMRNTGRGDMTVQCQIEESYDNFKKDLAS